MDWLYFAKGRLTMLATPPARPKPKPPPVPAPCSCPGPRRDPQYPPLALTVPDPVRTLQPVVETAPHAPTPRP